MLLYRSVVRSPNMKSYFILFLFGLPAIICCFFRKGTIPYAICRRTMLPLFILALFIVPDASIICNEGTWCWNPLFFVLFPVIAIIDLALVAKDIEERLEEKKVAQNE